MTTPLFKEALIESKKLKEVAESSALNSLLEGMSPNIKSLIDREIDAALINEAEEPALDPNMDMDPLAAVANDPSVASAASAAPAGSSEPLPTEPPGAGPADTVPTPTPMQPVSPSGAAPIATPAAMTGSPAIDPDGKITVDFEAIYSNPSLAPTDAPISSPADLSTPTPDTADSTISPEAPIDASAGDETAPMDLSGEEDQIQEMEDEMTFEYFKEMIGDIQESIKTKKAAIASNLLLKNTYETRLFNLFENLEKLKAKSQISEVAAKLSERHLNVLYQQIMESAKEGNSYTGQKGNSMRNKSLKEFAASLFEENSLAAEGDLEALANDAHDEHAKAKVHNSNESDKASKHAMSASKSKIEDPGKKASLTVSESDMGDGAALAALEEELSNMLGGGAGVMEEEEGAMDSGVSASDVQMEAAKIKQEALQRKLKALKEEQGKLEAELKECGMGSGAPVNVNISIEGPASVTGAGDEMSMGDELGMGDADDLAGDDMDAGDELGGMDDMGLGDDEEIEIVDDGEGGDEGGELGGDEEEEKEEPLAESKTPVAAKLVKENKHLKENVSELQLAFSKSLYMNKLFYNSNLSGGLKQKIASAMDEAKTLAEAKNVYETAKNSIGKLSSKSSTTRAAGTSAGIAKPGSTAAPLNESAGGGWTGPTFDPNRWQVLAGIKKNS